MTLQLPVQFLILRCRCMGLIKILSSVSGGSPDFSGPKTDFRHFYLSAVFLELKINKNDFYNIVGQFSDAILIF